MTSRRLRSWIYLFPAIALCLTFAACGDSKKGSSKSESDDEAHHHHEDEEGPHGGRIFEFGHEHKYHGEATVDEGAKKIVVYISDGKLKPLAVSAPEIAVHVTVDGKATLKKLTPVDAKDGKADQFESNDAVLYGALEDIDHITAKFAMIIDGTPWNGELVPHEHDEDE